jgi:hypothetical protein
MLNDLSPIIVTGGAGFIGSNFVLDWLALAGTPVVNLDKLTYAGNLQNLTSIEQHSGYHFEQGDICDAPFLDRILDRYQPRAILHFAAESRRRLFVPTSRALFGCSRPPGPTWRKALRRTARNFVFCMFPQMRFTALSSLRIRRSKKPLPMPPTVPTPLPRQPRTIWCALTSIVMGCRRLLPIARTTTVRINFRRNCSL